MTLAVFPCVLLYQGNNVDVVSGVTATQSTPSGSTLLATNPMFTVSGRRGTGSGNNITFHADGVGGVPTTATGAVYSSDNGGTTWNLVQGSIDLVAAGVATDYVLENVAPGLIYQMILTTVSLGGSATAVNVGAAVA